MSRLTVNVELVQQLDMGLQRSYGVPSTREWMAGTHEFNTSSKSKMRDFITSVSNLVMKNQSIFGILPKSILSKVHVLKTFDEVDEWILLTPNEIGDKTVYEIVVDDAENPSYNMMSMTFFLGKENNPNFVGCNFCGKNSKDMKREKTGDRRIFCHGDCQKHFYAGVFAVDIESTTLRNPHYRSVINTTKHQQLVLMSITPEDHEIGNEVHPHTTQLIRIEKGKGQAVVDGVTIELKDGSLIMVNPGAEHNIINTSEDEPLKLYSVYSPPHHPPGTLHKRKVDDKEDE